MSRLQRRVVLALVGAACLALSVVGSALAANTIHISGPGKLKYHKGGSYTISGNSDLTGGPASVSVTHAKHCPARASGTVIGGVNGGGRFSNFYSFANTSKKKGKTYVCAYLIDGNTNTVVAKASKTVKLLGK